MGDDATPMIPRRQALGRAMPGNIFFLFIIAIMCFAIFGSAKPAQNLDFPALTGRVVDNAHILDAATASQIESVSQTLEQQTGAQLVVATIPDLQSTSIEDYGYQLGRAWAIGRKGYDDGVLLLVAPNDREVRIEVGYGLEGILTDAASRVIIENQIIPQFKAGDMAKGTLEGAKAIALVVSDPDKKGELPVEGTVDPDPGPRNVDHWQLLQMLFIPLLIGLFPLMNIFNWIRALIDPVYGSQLVSMARRGNGGRWGGPWGGGGGGRSGGGGFSGGGGSFGGGGSSGRW